MSTPNPTIITGTVTGGRRIGSRIGFPTANLRLENRPEIENGVYAAAVKTPQGWYGGMVNIGHRPTVTENGERLLEVHLFGFDGNLYGTEIRVELVRYIRPEVKFGSLEELKAEIENDKRRILTLLKDDKRLQPTL